MKLKKFLIQLQGYDSLYLCAQELEGPVNTGRFLKD